LASNQRYANEFNCSFYFQTFKFSNRNNINNHQD
jgi:hypothetical protein